MYKAIASIDGEWWPHRFRAERATQLVVEYGFGVTELMKFFNWSRPDEAIRYVRLATGDLERKIAEALPA